MAYRFRLASVMRVRRAQEDIARNRLAEANMMLARVRMDRDRRVEHLGALVPSGGLQTLDEFQRECQVHALAAESVGLGNARVAETTQYTAHRRDEYLVARRRLHMLERLDQRRRAEYDIAENRRINTAVDDIVTTRWARAMAQDSAHALTEGQA